MHNKTRFVFPFSILSVCYGAVGVLFVTYIGLIAIVMSYAALTVEFSQSVKNDEATVAVLEGEYFAGISEITGASYINDGYAKPVEKTFVRAENVTVLR